MRALLAAAVLVTAFAACSREAGTLGLDPDDGGPVKPPGPQPPPEKRDRIESFTCRERPLARSGIEPIALARARRSSPRDALAVLSDTGGGGLLEIIALEDVDAPNRL